MKSAYLQKPFVNILMQENQFLYSRYLEGVRLFGEVLVMLHLDEADVCSPLVVVLLKPARNNGYSIMKPVFLEADHKITEYYRRYYVR